MSDMWHCRSAVAGREVMVVCEREMMQPQPLPPVLTGSAGLETELRLVAGWFMKGDDGGLLIDHGGGWISGVEFPNLSTYIDEVQP